MKRFRIWAGVGIVMMCCGISAAVEPTDHLDYAEGALDRTLSNLKDSVARLVEDNKAVAQASVELRGRIRTLKNDLVAAENERTKKAGILSSLQAQQQKRTGNSRTFEGQIAQAQKDLGRIRAQEIQLEETIGRRTSEEEAVRLKMTALEREIQALRSGTHASPEADVEMVALRSERDRLLQDIQAASQQLEQARLQWAEADRRAREPSLVRETSGEKERVAALRQELVTLKDKAVRQEETIAAFKAQGKAVQFISDLEADVVVHEEAVKTLQKEVSALQDKVSGLSKKTSDEKSRTSAESQYNEAKMRHARLRVELERLRSEMIRLDKKKTQMEKEVYGQKGKSF